LCQVIEQYPTCNTLDEFMNLFKHEIVLFEAEYPSVIDDFTIPQLKLQIYQQIIGQLPLRIEVNDLDYTKEDLSEALSIELKTVPTTQTPISLMDDEDFIGDIWQSLSLGLKVCNYQDTGIAAMRETMTVAWILAQSETFFKEKPSLIDLLQEEPGNHGFQGLGSLFG